MGIQSHSLDAATGAAERRMIMATEFNTQVGNGEYRLQFETDNKAHYLIMQSSARRCVDCEHMTNADRIRAMSDEELAVWIVEKTEYQESVFTYPTYLNFLTESDDTKEGAIKGTVDWLQQTVVEDDNG